MKEREYFFEKNIKSYSSNKFESPESYSFSMNKKELEKGLEDCLIKNKKKINKKISTSSLLSNKKNKANLANKEKHIYCHSNYYNKNKKYLNNSNSCPVLILNHFPKTRREFYIENNVKKINNYPYINNNYIESRNKNTNDAKNLLVKMQFYQKIPFYTKREKKTFYKPNNIDILLNKKIKIIKKPQTCNSSFDRNQNNKKKNKFELEFNYRYKKLFERRLPLNDLRNYKTILFEECKIPRGKSKLIPHHSNQRGFTNDKINSKIKYDNNTMPYEYYISCDKIDKNDIKNENNNKDNNNFEIIELNGVITKVMTKFQLNDLVNNNTENKNEDFHKVMKHPLSKETFGYKFLRNLNKDYKMNKNPLDDKDLIKKIHHLIINPNTKEFRNGNLMYNSAGFCKKRNISAPTKNYKSLSKKGYIKLKNYKINRFKQDVEDSKLHIEGIKEKLNILMERNIKIFKVYREELENKEKLNNNINKLK